MIDTGDFNRPHPEDAVAGMFAYESIFVFDGPWEISRMRFEHLDPTTEQGCIQPEEILELEFDWDDLYERSEWDDPALSQLDREMRQVLVSTSTLCSHSPSEVGDVLAPDCNACTAAVCDEVTGDPSCCDSQWTQSCVDRAAATCGALADSQPQPAAQ